MKFDAITIDTNIFDQNHLKLDEGLLKRLRQFKDKLTQFVLSEVIAGELKQHLTRQSQQAKDALASATRKVGDSELLFEQAYWDLLEKADTPNAAEAAQKRLDRFLEATGCEIISANKADMDRLIKMYFDPSAPFETSKNKKSEFPDAIALITMEDWAKQNNKKLLAITKDQGWIDFAAKSDWIFTEQDLAVGLEMLQDDAEIARGLVTSFLNRMENGEEPAALERFQSDIKYEVDDLMPNADGNSGFHMDTPIANVEFKSVQIVHDGDGYDLTIVESSKDAIVARLPIEIEARATATFEFQIKDEGDYLPVASGSGDMTWKFEAGAVLTIIGDYTSTPPALELDDVEMVDAPESVDFGYVEMDIDPDDRYGD